MASLRAQRKSDSTASAAFFTRWRCTMPENDGTASTAMMATIAATTITSIRLKPA